MARKYSEKQKETKKVMEFHLESKIKKIYFSPIHHDESQDEKETSGITLVLNEDEAIGLIYFIISRRIFKKYTDRNYRWYKNITSLTLISMNFFN
jgi:hypothetical protein